ncbi:MAG: metal ABC transporter substrate-binding protein [Puniceicoccales bacterium]|jgi:zinc/manganese transport system substrate-binding protein|nr:metal ABC transporter substrate-binding protein [Puniceicoccales bacterium]
MRISSMIFGAFALFLTAVASASTVPLRVVASFTIPADWAREIAGVRASVESLVPPSADPHLYQPTLADMRKLYAADVIVAIDPTLENWFVPLVADASLRKKTLWLAQTKETAHTVANAAQDPHLWMDALLVVPMCNRLAERFTQVAPADAGGFAARSAKYAVSLREIDAWAHRTLAAVPVSRRILFSHHDNLSRLANRYGLRYGGALIANVSSESPDPSARELAAFIRRIRKAKTPLFHDSDTAPTLVKMVTRNAALPPPVRIYSDALQPSPHPASTYLGMYRENIRIIAEALNVSPNVRLP